MSDIATEVQPDLAAVAASTVEPTTPAVEESGQGEGGTTPGLYSLDAIPESIRDQVLPVFKEWEGNVTREFQKRADQVKAFEPYDQLGIRDIPVEDMQHLKSFYEIASNEESFKEWVREVAGQFGLLEGGEPVEESEAAPAAEEAATAGLTPEQVEAMIQERIESDRQTREQEAQQAEIRDTIAREVRTTLDELKGSLDDPELFDEDLICHFASRHQTGGASASDALKAGFADFQRLTNAAASKALDQKVKQPAATAVVGGQPNSAPTPATTFAEARERTLARLRAENAQ
jgi:hypothetical protein